MDATKIKGNATVLWILVGYWITVAVKRHSRIDRFAVFVVCKQGNA